MKTDQTCYAAFYAAPPSAGAWRAHLCGTERALRIHA